MPAHISPRIPDNLRREFPERLKSAHRLDGWAAPGPDVPLLFFRTPKSKIDKVVFVAQGFRGFFGGTLVIRAAGKEYLTRTCVHPAAPEFDQIRNGRFIAVFVRGRSEIVGSREVQLEWVTEHPVPPEWQDIMFSTEWSLAAKNVPTLKDDRANYWECLASMKDFYDKFTAEDQLSIGWVMDFQRLVRMTDMAVKQIQKGEPLVLSNKEVKEHIGIFVDIMNNPNLSVQLLVDTVSEYLARGQEAQWKLRECLGKLTLGARSNRERELIRLLSLARQVYYRSSEMTKEGKRVVLIDLYRSQKMGFVDLEPREFPQTFSPLSYWQRLPTGHIKGFNGCLTGRDLPMDLGPNSPLWKTFPVAENVETSFDAADLLLSEALASKKWTIPNGAVVKLRAGPFDYFELWEFTHGVYFLGRSENAEYVPFWLNMEYGYLKFEALDPYKVTTLTSDEAGRLHAALMLLLSAIVRDFLVIETRESVFETRRQRLTMHRMQREGTITVYLPRIKYISSADIQKCASELSHQDRRPHFVRPHLRKSSTASEHQLLLATRYGFDVPTGYTFVRPHERGQKSRDTIYRSRSALQSLYQGTSPGTGRSEKPAEWFQFERDVQTVMKKLGFKTEHVAASHRGDHGVDVYATKGRDLDAISWVIQCKCYSPNRKVQPSTVRELLGVLEEYPRGTRGMIVTTSSFTSGAQKRAEEANIYLIEGEEFTRLLGSETTG